MSSNVCSCTSGMQGLFEKVFVEYSKPSEVAEDLSRLFSLDPDLVGFEMLETAIRFCAMAYTEWLFLVVSRGTMFQDLSLGDGLLALTNPKVLNTDLTSIDQLSDLVFTLTEEALQNLEGLEHRERVSFVRGLVLKALDLVQELEAQALKENENITIH